MIGKNTAEFLGRGFLLVFNSNYRHRTHRSATIHERDQPTNDVTTRSIAKCVCR